MLERQVDLASYIDSPKSVPSDFFGQHASRVGCSADDCDAPLTIDRRAYCSERCRQREKKRRLRNRDLVLISSDQPDADDDDSEHEYNVAEWCFADDRERFSHFTVSSSKSQRRRPAKPKVRREIQDYET